MNSLLPVLAGRWSPRAFDSDHVVTTDQIEILLEAARWAPSAGNSQPWAFHVAQRGTSEHDALVPLLAGSSQPWASQAGVLMVNLCHRLVEQTDWQYSEFAEYDLGQAVAHLTIQAHSMGLACRQFAAFDRGAVSELLGVPEHWTAMTMTAIGVPSVTASRSAGSATRAASVRWGAPEMP